MSNLLEVKNLTVGFRVRDSIFTAVENASFEINKNETMALVGESGSGKSVTSLSAMRLIPSPPGVISNGEIIFHQNNGANIDLLKISCAFLIFPIFKYTSPRCSKMIELSPPLSILLCKYFSAKFDLPI